MEINDVIDQTTLVWFLTLFLSVVDSSSLAIDQTGLTSLAS